MRGGDWGKGVDVYSVERLRPEASQQNRVRGRIGGVVFEAGPFELLAGDCRTIDSCGGAWGEWLPENRKPTLLFPKWCELAIDADGIVSITRCGCMECLAGCNPDPHHNNEGNDA